MTQLTHHFATLLTRLLQPGTVDSEWLDSVIHPDYVQEVDGYRLDRDAFVSHLDHLHATLRRCEVQIEHLFCAGDRVHSSHRVTATLDDETEVSFLVCGVFTFRDGKLWHTFEVTRQLTGAPEHQDLGSRLAASD